MAPKLNEVRSVCRRGVVSGLLVLVGAMALSAGRSASAARSEAAIGTPARIPWTASRVVGTPEPPPPYETRRAFANLTFEKPLDIAFESGSGRIFVAEQYGKIYSFPNDERCSTADLALDVRTQVKGLDKVPYSRGLDSVYGIAVHPHFRENHYLYVCYALGMNAPPGVRLTPKNQQGTRISRFTVSDTNPPRIDPASERIILTWFAGGHNGGCIKFGPDGYLYISSGDGGDPDPPDPFGTGQDISDLLSSILRIDVDHPSPDGKPYSIPADNPFVHTPGARPEVWAYGLRNPWRMSFDSQSGNLWVGDVGWELWESVVCAKAGGNYGWSIMEGPNPVHPDGPRGPTPLVPPVIALSHSEAASLTGGIVYHGNKLPGLRGHYLFGDWQTSRLWAAKCNGDKLEPHKQIAQTDQRIVAFGEQPDGEVLIVDHGGGGLWRIVPNEAAGRPSHFPRKLSETGLFASVKDQAPAPGVIPFSINAPQWVDGATAQRWIAVPGSQGMSWGKGVWGDDKPAWPQGSVLVRTLSLAGRQVETQLLHFDGKQWHGYTYAWNDQQTDADLVDSAGDDKPMSIPDPSAPGGVLRRRWHFASGAQCMTCHNVWSDYALAFNEPQLDRMGRFGDGTDNQIHAFREMRLLPSPMGKSGDSSSNQKLTLTDPYEPSADLNERARSYLHTNCSQCHRFGGGGSALFDVRKELPPEAMHLINAKPNLGDFGIKGAKIVSAGDPARSVLLYRMAKLGRGRMPHIGSDVVDVKGLDLMRRWIGSLGESGGGEYSKELRLLEDGAGDYAAVSAATERLLSSSGGALSLVCEIDNGKLAPKTLEMVTTRGIGATQDSVRDLFRRFDPNEQQADRLGPNINPAKLLALHGDAARGRVIFYEQTGAGLCARCHITNGRGADFGPDLSHIASKYNRADLLDNILNPSKTIAPGYITYIVRTKAGDTYSGFLISKSEREIVIKDAQLQHIHVPAGDVQKVSAQPVSAMPEGLLSDLTPQQAADVLEFLSGLK